MADDMLAWLRSQILATKAAAEDAHGESWGVYDYVAERSDGGGDERRMLYDVEEDAELFSITIGATSATEDHLRHAALNDPRDALARCEFELGEVARHTESPFYDCQVCGEHYAEYPCDYLRRHVFGYRHRPGWNPDWAPEGMAT